MASKSTNSMLWTLAIIAVLGFAAFELIPALLKKIGSGSSSGTGSNSVGGVQYYPPDYGQDQGQGQQNPLGLSFGGPPGSSNGQGGTFAGGNILSNFLNQVTGYNAQTMPYFNQQNANLDYESQANDTIPLEAYQNLSDLPSWSPDDPNAPWNSDSNGSTLLETTDYSNIDTVDGSGGSGAIGTIDGSGGAGLGGSGGSGGGGGAAGDNNGTGFGS
jgi:hypothetical protein